MSSLLIIFGFSTLITLVVFGFIIAIKFIEYKSKISAVEEKLNNSEKVQFQQEMASMQHRLVVLERIVTDKGYQVNEEISRLKPVR